MCVARSEQWEAVKELLVTSSCVALKANCPLERELLNPIEAEAKGRIRECELEDSLCGRVQPAVTHCEQPWVGRLDP